MGSGATRRRWALVATGIGGALFYLDLYIVTVALPTVQSELALTSAQLAWTLNAVFLTAATGMVTGGRLCDVVGRRRVFVAGVIVFLLASALAGLAEDGWWLVAARAGQGVGAALFFPACSPIIVDAFPPAERAQAVGVWVGAVGVGMALGPIAGGVLTEWVGWRAVFFVNLPVGVLALVAALYGIRESRGRAGSDRVDVLGAVTLTAGLLALVIALQQSQTAGWLSPPVLALLGLGGAALGLFIAVERRARHPLVDFALFRIPAYARAIAVSLLTVFVLSALILFGTLYLQRVLGRSPSAAGLWFLPLTLMYVGIGPLAGRLSARLGARIPLVAGTVALLAALVLFARAGPSSTAALLGPAFVLAGIGLGSTYTVTTSSAMAAVPLAQAGAASGILSMARMGGAVFGVALTHSLFESVDERRLHALLTLLTGQPGAAQEAARVAYATAFDASMLLCAGVAAAAVLAAAGIGARAAPAVADARATA